MLEGLLAAVALQAPAAASFTPADFAHVARLAGRWEGRPPTGEPYLEDYVLADPRTLRITRPPAEGAPAVAGAVVRLTDGAITSEWEQYRWRAVEVTPSLIRFEPLNAPSAFSWGFIDAGTVEVTQNFRDVQGAPQSFSFRMTRVR